MAQEKNNTKKRRFQHLTSEKRAQIEVLLRLGLPKTQIAKEVGISRPTLYNELKRGTVTQMDTNLKEYQKYFWDAGQRVYEKNRKNSRPPLKLIKAFEFVQYAEEQILKNKLSPDAICGEAKLTGRFENIVCTQTLYNYIDQQLFGVKNIDLLLKVRRKNNKNNEGKEHTNKRIFGTSIEERPEEINDRITFGHWENDTVIGKRDGGAALLTVDERLTRKIHIAKIPSKSKEGVRIGFEKIAKRYGDKFGEVFKSVTSDNGSEFADLQSCFPETAKVYYAHPYSAWERGTNEKQNSIIRRFFPKGTSFDDVTDEQIAFVENWINNLPRKILGYKSPNTVFQAAFNEC